MAESHVNETVDDAITDQRSFFRINEDIILDYKIVEAFTANQEQAHSQFPESDSLALFDRFRRIDGEASVLLNQISTQNRSIADYLANMNKKIDALAQHLLKSKTPHNQIKTTQVNLSEGGIAFASERPIYKGSYLALHILFLPGYASLALFAKVVRSETRHERHHLAAKFHRLEEQQRLILSRHIIKAQQNAKRREKNLNQDRLA